MAPLGRSWVAPLGRSLTPGGTRFAANPSSGQVTMDSPKTINVSWKTQHYLTVNSERGNPRGSGWYDHGTTTQWSVTSPIDVGNMRHKARPSSSGSVAMDGPKTVTVSWESVELVRLTIHTAKGQAHGAGLYEKGTTATWSVTPPTIPGVNDRAYGAIPGSG